MLELAQPYERCVIDVDTAAAEMRRRGARVVVLLGYSGGASLTALAQAETGCGDGWVGIAAHPGEGVFMGQVIDPSVVDESDPFSTDQSLDMYDPANGWQPWPAPSQYDSDWLIRYRAAQQARVARIDAIAHAEMEAGHQAGVALETLTPASEAWRQARRRAVHIQYLTIYRTLADPAYLSLSIDPSDRALGSVFASPDPMDANWGGFGLGRVMTSGGWLSTWSSLSSKARLEETISRLSCPRLSCPLLLVHPTADTEIRLRQVHAIRDAATSASLSYHEIKGASHYLEGHRQPAMEIVAEWIRGTLA